MPKAPRTPPVSPVDDNSTADVTDSRSAPGEFVAENLARIGVALGCQRVELFGITDGDTVRLDAWWASLDHPTPPIPPNAAVVDLSWFPWSLGNVFSLQYMFVRNADALPCHPDDPLELGDLGFSSVLQVAVADAENPRGAVCCYWRDERSDPGEWSWSSIVELAGAALDRIS